YRNSAAWRWASPPCSASSGSSAMACNSGKGTSLPITAAVCRRRFSSGGSRSIRAASTACTVAATLAVRTGRAARERPAPPRPGKHPGLGQGGHPLSQEEGVALGACNQQLFERFQAGGGPQEGLQELVGPRRRQWIQPQLRVVGLAAPAVLILRAIVDQEENT